MLLTFLSRLMSSLLTTLLFVTVVGFTASQTILNTHYIENKLQSQNAYDRLSDALSTQISKDSKDPTISQTAVAAQLKTVLTPEVLKQKISITLKQLNEYFHGKGSVPTLDVSDLVQSAQTAGLQIDDDKFSKPVTLTDTSKVKKVSDIAKLAGIAEVVLLIGILVIAIKRHDYRPLANIVFSLGIMLTVTGAVLLFAPQLLNRLHHIDATKDSLSSLAYDLGTSTFRDFGLRLLIPSAIALLLGILAKVMLRGHRPKQQKPQIGTAASIERDSNTPIDTTEASVPAQNEAAVPAPAPTTEPTRPTDSVPGAPPRPKKPRKIQL
jgi:hypothetical protein